MEIFVQIFSCLLTSILFLISVIFALLIACCAFICIIIIGCIIICGAIAALYALSTFIFYIFDTSFVLFWVKLFAPFTFICCIITVLYFLTHEFPSIETQEKEKYYSRTRIKNSGETKGYTFVWKIENLGACCLRKGECIKSPAFNADSLDGTKWSLRLFPKGVKNDNLFTVFLKREKDCNGPKVIHVNYRIAFLGKDGSILEDKPARAGDFEREDTGFFPACARREKVFCNEGKNFISEVNLTVQCKLWKKNELFRGYLLFPVVSEFKYALTTYKVQRKSFVWRVGKFSTIRSARRSKFTDGLIDFHFFLTERLGSGKGLCIDIRSVDDSIQYFSFKATIIDSKGIKIKCGDPKYLHGDLKKGMAFELFFTRNFLIENRTLYLPNDVLSLECQCVYTTAAASYDKCEVLRSAVIQEDVKKDKHKVTSVLSKFMCKDTKVELRTSTQTFQAHRAVLTSRSTVFRKMLHSDMNEKKSGPEHVNITDLDDETLQRMIAYLYSDSLGDLQMESASKLYTAAVKYGILSLKRRCSSFLKGNLYPSTACDVLVLADKHQDNDLKSVVKDYILKHYKEVLDTLEWTHMMSTNPELAAHVMCCKIFKK